MKLQNHEKFIKDKVEKHEVDLDVDGLWSGLEAFVPEKKKRRLPLFLLLFGVLCLGMILGVFMLTYVDRTKAFQKVEDSEYALNPSRQSGTPVMDTSSKHEPYTNRVEEQSNKTILEKDERVSIQRIDFQRSSEGGSMNKLITKDEDHIDNTYNNQNAFKRLKQDGQEPEDKYRLVEDPIIFDEQTTTETQISGSLGHYDSGITRIESIETKNGVAREPLEDGNLNTMAIVPFNIILGKSLVRQDVNVLSERQIQTWQIYMRCGVNFHRGRLSPKDVDAAYMNTYKDIHTDKASWSAEMGLQYLINKNWDAHLGMAFDNVVTQIEHTFSQSIKSQGYGTKDVLITTSGALVKSDGKTGKITKTTYTGTWYNSRVYMGLKLGLDYHVKLKKHYIMHAQLGGYTHFNTWHRGSFLNDKLEIQDFPKGGNSTFKLGIRPYFTWGIRRYITRNMSIGIYATYMPLQSTYNNLKINDHIYNIGLTCRYEIQ